MAIHVELTWLNNLSARGVRAALANGIGGQIADHYRQLPVIGGWLGDQIGGVDRYLIDPRNRAFAFVFGHYIYTLDGGGQL